MKASNIWSEKIFINNEAIYAYEVGGLGNASADAMTVMFPFSRRPYVGYCSTEDEIFTQPVNLIK